MLVEATGHEDPHLVEAGGVEALAGLASEVHNVTAVQPHRGAILETERSNGGDRVRDTSHRVVGVDRKVALIGEVRGEADEGIKLVVKGFHVRVGHCA